MLRQGSWLIAATVISQGLQFIGTLALARYFTPADLGLLLQFSALLLLGSAGAVLSLPAAFALESQSAARQQLLSISAFSALVIALVFSFGYQFLAQAEFVQFQQLAPMILLLPIGIFATSLVLALQQLHYARQQFIRVAQLAILFAALFCTFRLLVAVTQSDISVLIWLAALLPLLHAISLFWQYCRCEPLSLVWLRSNYLTTSWQLLHRYREFVCYQTPQQYLNVFSQNLPLLLIAGWYGAAQAGYYAICIALLGAPALLINRSIGDVLYPKFATLKADSSALASLFYKVTISLACIMAIPFVVLLFWHKQLFGVVLGEQWQTAATYAAMLTPWFFLVCLNSPSLKILMLFRQQRLSLILNIATLVLRVGGLFMCFDSKQPVLVSIMLLSGLGVLHNAAVLGLAFYTLRQLRLADKLVQQPIETQEK